MFACSGHSQVETIAGHSFFRDQTQHPVFLENGPAICDVGFQKDSLKMSFGKKLKSHFMDQHLFEIHEGNVNLPNEEITVKGDVTFSKGYITGKPKKITNKKTISIKGVISIEKVDFC